VVVKPSDQVPLVRLRVSGSGLFDMLQIVCLQCGRANTPLNHRATSDIETGNQGRRFGAPWRKGTVAKVLKLCVRADLDAWVGQVLAFQGLNPVISSMHTVRSPSASSNAPRITFTDVFCLQTAGRGDLTSTATGAVSNRFFIGRPMSIVFTMPCLITSSASSLGVND